MKLPTPADHPNASAALIAGYISQVLVFAGNKAGLEITPQEGMTAGVALIGLVLFVAGKKS